MNRDVQQLLGSTHRLMVFDAVVQAGSFTQAAASLAVSQPAVSRQIAKLEDQLQTELFRRESNRVSLTKSGESLHAYVVSAFHELTEGVRQIRGSSDDLTLAVQPAIADSWFSPRLASLQEAVAPTTIRLVIYDYEQELATLSHDVSVRFGRGFGPGLRSTKMAGETVLPVASPDLAKRFGLSSMTAATELVDGPALLRLDGTSRKWLDWVGWFEASGLSWTAPSDGVVQRSYGVLVHQALSGRGVVLGWETLLGDLLSRSMLVQVGPRVERPKLGYHFVWPSGLDRHDGLRRLRAWTRDTLESLRESD